MSESDLPGERLQKVLAQLGMGSRRALEGLIEAGRVSVNGKPAKLGDRVVGRERVKVDGRLVDIARAFRLVIPRVVLLNKPPGTVCTRSDPEGRPTVFELLPKLGRGRWISVGRLDVATAGLLLFTDDGALANALMHPSANIDREYAVRLLGHPDEQALEQLRTGVLLDDGPAAFTDIRHYGGQGTNVWYHVCLMEGRNREVRRLWEAVGITVSRLKRVRFGPVVLPSRLKVGRHEFLAPVEAWALAALVGQAHERPTGKLDFDGSALIPYPRLPDS